MERADLETLLARRGCKVAATPSGGLQLISCPDDEAKIGVLDDLAWHDARYDARVRALAKSIVGALPVVDKRAIASGLHAAVRDRVRYLGEGVETFQSPTDTWESRLGDCDCNARLLAALARAVGNEATIEGAILRRPNGDPRHASVRLHDGVSWKWAETTLPAYFGEHPIAAFMRTTPAGARTDLESGSELGAVPIGQVASNSRHARGRAILAAAWDRLAGAGKAKPATVAGLQAAAAIVLGEGGYGDRWQGAGVGSNNWGAIQCKSQATPCPAGCFAQDDTHSDGSKYHACFKVYATPDEGAEDFLKEVLVRRPDTAAALAGEALDADAIARAMYFENYYQGFCQKAARAGHFNGPNVRNKDQDPICQAEAMGGYAKSIASLAATVATALEEPTLVTRGGAAPASPPASGGGSLVPGAIGGALLVASAAALLYRFRGPGVAL